MREGESGRNGDLDKEDLILIDHIAEGDDEAFRKLFERYYPMIYRFIIRINRSPELAEEAVDDTLFEVWKKAKKFRKSSKVSTWIYGIAYYKALKSLRGINDFQDDTKLEGMPDPADSPEKIYEAREIQGHIHEALQTLSAEQRTAMELAFFNELPYSEIARIMGCDENTVKTRIFRAKKKLNHILIGVTGEKS